MSDEKEPMNESANAAPNTSEQIEVPVPKKGAGWEMPAPVFQQSSGYLPQGFEKRYPANDGESDVPTDEPMISREALSPQIEVSEAPSPPPGLDVSETPDVGVQPFVSEEFTLDKVDNPVPTTKRANSGGKAALTIFGVLAMIALAVVFLVIVWYLFFYHPSDPGILN